MKYVFPITCCMIAFNGLSKYGFKFFSHHCAR
jgi:hypothetical protein